MEGFPTRNDILDPERGHLKFLVLFVLVGDDKDKWRIGLDTEFFWTKAMLVKCEHEFWRGIGGRRERLLRSHEVGELLGVTPKTVALWARTGKLAATTTAGGHRRFRRSDVDAILAQRERR